MLSLKLSNAHEAIESQKATTQTFKVIVASKKIQKIKKKTKKENVFKKTYMRHQ